MSDKTSIEWTRSDDGTPGATWNPVTGCTKISKGCDNCYAETLAERFRGTPGHYFEGGFDVQLRDHKLYEPIRWKKPRRIFVNSMSDLLHDDVPDEYIARAFAVMAATPQHTYQLLTKRHGRMRSLLRDECRCGAGHPPGEHFRAAMEWAATPHSPTYVPGLESGLYHRMAWPLPNVWLGVSVENQRWADIRIPALLDTPAAVRFLSCEPLVGPVDLSQWLGPAEDPPCWNDHSPAAECSRCIQPDWLICGGESGPGARPMHPEWARGLRDQCEAAGVPFFFKQWGEWIPETLGAHVITERTAKTAQYADLTGGHRPANRGARNGAATCHRVGKKAAGRELDGRTWDEFPQAAVTATP